jgi:Na+-translocating ferredoxin:NAD+ oxidoreductase subunit G
MAKLQSSFKNMVVALTGVSLIASASLGLVNDMTKEAIAAAETKKQVQAISTVLPKFESLGMNYKTLPTNGKDSIEVYPALDSTGNVIGNAVKSYSYNGFSGYIEVMIGFDIQGAVTGYQVLKHAETPGLGTKMTTWFNDPAKERQNIIGKNPTKCKLVVSKDGGDIDAITAATISSRAFLDAINRGYSVLNEQYDGKTSATSKTEGE